MNRIKYLRNTKQISQVELAEKIGVHYRTLQNWENGVSEIKNDNAKKLADYFEVPVSYLLGFSDNKRENHDSSLSDELKKIRDENSNLTFYNNAFNENDFLKLNSSQMQNFLKYKEIYNNKDNQYIFLDDDMDGNYFFQIQNKPIHIKHQKVIKEIIKTYFQNLYNE